ncbi:hypothetical protein [Spirosoma spitsbergense]|uniref:hypothetical protein n=1 Tax=Spirosoma spitsbergense TaxID=431554 RepID=UPI00035DB584|nr:hypothetical protein [Spirosoma spitsbergense]
MKTITLSIDIKSFLLGVLTVGGILVLANFTPADKAQPKPALLDTRRFQMIVHERETVILDTETGRFVVNPSYLGKPRWISGDFEALQRESQKK